MAEARQMANLLVQEFAGLAQLCDVRHHRNHELEFAAGRRLQQRPELGAQQTGTIKRKSDRAPPQSRVLFLGCPEIGHDLVTTDIERAECDRLFAGLARDKGISKKLLSYHRIPVPEFAVFRMGSAVRRPRRHGSANTPSRNRRSSWLGPCSRERCGPMMAAGSRRLQRGTGVNRPRSVRHRRATASACRDRSIRRDGPGSIPDGRRHHQEADRERPPAAGR